MVIEVKDGKVRVTESDCPYKICVKQGWIDRGSIVCLPNNTVTTVKGPLKNGEDVDAITG